MIRDGTSGVINKSGYIKVFGNNRKLSLHDMPNSYHMNKSASEHILLLDF